MFCIIPETTLSTMSAKVAGAVSQVVVELATHWPPRDGGSYRVLYSSTSWASVEAL